MQYGLGTVYSILWSSLSVISSLKFVYFGQIPLIHLSSLIILISLHSRGSNLDLLRSIELRSFLILDGRLSAGWLLLLCYAIGGFDIKGVAVEQAGLVDWHLDPNIVRQAYWYLLTARPALSDFHIQASCKPSRVGTWGDCALRCCDP